jgi:hypothetical protein
MPVQVVKYAGFMTAADALKDLGLACIATFVDLPGEASASYAPRKLGIDYMADLAAYSSHLFCVISHKEMIARMLSQSLLLKCI